MPYCKTKLLCQRSIAGVPVRRDFYKTPYYYTTRMRSQPLGRARGVSALITNNRTNNTLLRWEKDRTPKKERKKVGFSVFAAQAKKRISIAHYLVQWLSWVFATHEWKNEKNTWKCAQLIRRFCSVAALQTNKQSNKFISIIFIDMLLNFLNNIYMLWSQYIICYTISKQHIYVGNMNIICRTICKQHMYCICLRQVFACGRDRGTPF